MSKLQDGFNPTFGLSAILTFGAPILIAIVVSFNPTFGLSAILTGVRLV